MLLMNFLLLVLWLSESQGYNVPTSFLSRRSVSPLQLRLEQHQQRHNWKPLGFSSLQPGHSLMRTSTQSRSSTVLYFEETSGGFMELQEFTEKFDEKGNLLTKQASRKPGLLKLAGFATIPLSAALGYTLVPSGGRVAVNAVSAVLTGIAGAVGKSRLDAYTDDNAKPALARALIDAGGVDDVDAARDAITSVRESFGLLDEDYNMIAVELYSTYLLGMVKYLSRPKTSEIRELDNLRQILQMDNLQVGEAHAMAATRWFQQNGLASLQDEMNVSEEDVLNRPSNNKKKREDAWTAAYGYDAAMGVTDDDGMEGAVESIKKGIKVVSDEDFSKNDKETMNKLLFLTERVLRNGGETQEAFRFEMTRVAKALRLSFDEAMERIVQTVEPFYQRALKSTRNKLGTNQVSSETLEKARQTLGLVNETAYDMHIVAFNEEVRSLLGLPETTAVDDDDDEEDDDDEADSDKEGKSDGPAVEDLSNLKFSPGASERLKQLKDILVLSDADAEYEICSEATPLFQSTCSKVMKDVLSNTKTADEAWDVIVQRQKELLLNDESVKKLLSSIVMQALGGPLEETNKFAKVNNEAATYEHLLEALDAKEVLLSILAKSGWDEYDRFDEIFCNPWNKQSANGFLSSEERVRLYRMFLVRSVRRNNKFTDEVYDKIQQVKGLLGITDLQAEVEARSAFGPELQKVMRRAMVEIVEDYTPELAQNMKNEIQPVQENYRLSDQYLREMGASFYAKAVESISDKAPGGIPDEKLAGALEALRDLYKLTIEDCYPAHLEHFGAIYRKSILEAMGSTGIIREEFRGPLEKLRSRLGVSAENSKELFLAAVREKMKPMVQWIGSEMERTVLTKEQMSKRRGKDLGEDVFQSGKSADGILGLGAEVNVMKDIMNLIDFYNENDIAEERETGKEIVEKKVPTEDGEEKTVTEEVPIIETVYPVTALEMGAIDAQMAELLYRQFIVSGFTNQGEQAERYEAARDAFAGILGLSKEQKASISDNIGSTVYDNYVTNAMKTKGVMDQQDMMFLANIQGKLGLTPEQGEKMLQQAQQKILTEEINAIMVDPTPESIKAFREKCNAMGMDLAEDVGISKQRLSRMFESEIIPGLQKGEITVDNNDILTEVQESLGLDEEECESMFATLLRRMSKAAMDVIKAELLRGREENCVDLIKQIARYGAFLDGDLELEVEEATAYKILNIYEALDFEGVTPEDVQNDLELLRVVVGLSSPSSSS